MSKFNLPITKRYRLSCTNFTISVGVNGINYIEDAAPIAKKFIGQPLENLERWMKKIGGFEKTESN